VVVLSRRFNELRFKILEFHGRNDEAYFAIPVATRLVLISLVVDGGGYDGVHRVDGDFLNLRNVDLASKYYLCN